MKCCGNCLNSDFIREHIAIKSESEGDCTLCDSAAMQLISVENLVDLFAPLFELYRLNPNGEPLIDLLKKDWLLFSNVPTDRVKVIFKDAIYGDENLSLNYTPAVEATDLYDWNSFKEELKHINRFFPTMFPNPTILSSLISYLSSEKKDNRDIFYRARVQKDRTQPYMPNEMGPPPKQHSTSGRANPFGISYLYLGSTENTAVSEVRPHNNDVLTIGQFYANQDLKLVDLREPRKTIVPFRYSEANLKNIYQGLNLLETLGKELTKPVSEHTAHLEYLSCQYLCEFIKSQDYDGVVYKSSLGDGDNYAIFDSDKLRCEGTNQVQVNSVDITHTQLN